MEHTLTVRLEIWDGDATQYFLLPMPVTGIMDVVRASFDDGKWMIQGNEGGTPFAGRGEYKHDAILNYFRARLGFVSVIEANLTQAEIEQACKEVGAIWNGEVPGRATTPEQKRAIMDRLYQAWLRASAQRLGQLLLCSLKTDRDIFYREDEDLVRDVETFVASHQSDAAEEQEWHDIVSTKRDGIRRLAQEAREGETEEGGFAVEEEEGP